MTDDFAALARRAADIMEAALDAEAGEPGLPVNLAAQLRAGVRIAREAADSDPTDRDPKKTLLGAWNQLQTPPMVFLPHEVTRAAEQARLLLDRAVAAAS